MSISDDQMVQMLSEIKESTGRMEGKLNATIDAYDTRFMTLEDQMKTNDTRQWVASVCVIPIVTALHYLANKLGFKV